MYHVPCRSVYKLVMWCLTQSSMYLYTKAATTYMMQALSTEWRMPRVLLYGKGHLGRGESMSGRQDEYLCELERHLHRRVLRSNVVLFFEQQVLHALLIYLDLHLMLLLDILQFSLLVAQFRALVLQVLLLHDPEVIQLKINMSYVALFVL